MASFVPFVTGCRACALGMISSLGLFVAGQALAQIPPEIPMTNKVGVGAKSMGMAGAFSAVADDYSALYYNPSGLAQIRRSEFGVAFNKRTVDVRTEYLGNVEDSSLRKTRINALGFAYPFPTYRGSLVIGFAYQRVTPSDIDYFRESQSFEDGQGPGIDYEVEEIAEEGSVGAYQMGVAWDVSPKVSVGITGTILSGKSDRSREFLYLGTNLVDYESTFTRTQMDIHGFTGTLGALFRFNEKQGRVGLVLHLPEKYTLDGFITDDVIRVQQSPPDTLDYIDEFTFSDKMTLPFRLTAALAYEVNGMLLSGEITYADWSQIDYYGTIKTSDREFAYRETMDWRLGAQYTLPTMPVRLRAGFAVLPLGYQVIATDVFYGTAEKASFARENRFWSVGVGVTVDPALTLDGAWISGGFERSGSSEITETVEKITDERFYLSATLHI